MDHESTHIKPTHKIWPLIKIATPLALVSCIQSSVFFTQNLFLAKLSIIKLAAGSLVSWLFATFMNIVLGILGSMNVIIAHHYGAQKNAEITKVTRDGILMAFMMSITASSAPTRILSSD